MTNQDNEKADEELILNEKRVYDPKFRGPINDRSCTDVICLALFFVCVFILIIIAILAYANGDPAILLHPIDSNGHVCGMESYEDRPYLFFFDLTICARQGSLLPIRGCPTPQICLTECPTKDWFYATYANDSSTLVTDALCVDSISKQLTGKELYQHVALGNCASYYLESQPLVGRCVPKIFYNTINSTLHLQVNHVDIKNSLNQTVNGNDIFNSGKAMSTILNAVGKLQKIVADIQVTWWKILLLIGLAVVISFLWCVTMQWFACVLTYVTLLLFFITFIGAGGFCYLQFAFVTSSSNPAPTEMWYNSRNTQNQNSNNNNNNNSTIPMQASSDYKFSLQVTWLALAVISWLCALIIALLLICFSGKLRLAIAVLEEASKTIGAIKTTLLFPFLPWLTHLMVIIFIASVILYLAATGKVVRTVDNCNNSTVKNKAIACAFIGYAGTNWPYYVIGYALFMGFWFTCFITAMGQLILAGTFASWYFAREKPKDLPFFPILSSVYRGLRYHIGTVALASLLLAIVWMIRVLLQFIQHRLQSSTNLLAKFLVCILQCFFWCLEKILCFITKNALIITAIHGRCFCFAAKDAFFLILRNSLRLIVVDNVTDLILFVGKLLVSGFVTLVAFVIFTTEPIGTINYIYVPTLLVLLGAWLVVSVFFGVYSFAVDTLFICVMEDLERNDGSEEKPYFMSTNLMQVLDKKNEAVANGEGKNHSSCLFCCCC